MENGQLQQKSLYTQFISHPSESFSLLQKSTHTLFNSDLSLSGTPLDSHFLLNTVPSAKSANGFGWAEVDAQVARNKNEHRLDAHHMIRFYEEEEKNIEFEIKQDEKLLFVLEKEAQLTRQLSVEQLFHFARFNQLEMDKSNRKNGGCLALHKNSDNENDETEVR